MLLWTLCINIAYLAVQIRKHVQQLACTYIEISLTRRMERAKTAFVIYFAETSYHEHSHILTYYDRSINKKSLERWRKRAVQFQRFAQHAKRALGSNKLWCNITYITFSNEIPKHDTSSSSFYPGFQTSFDDIFFSGTSTRSCMLIFFNSFQHLSATR